MINKSLIRLHYLLAVALTVAAGCTAITIEPTCPNELNVGESGSVQANVRNPGAIAEYLWEVFPADAGTFASATSPDTTFEPAKEGEAIIRLTASDGLYQVVSQCSTLVGDTALRVQPSCPNELSVGEPGSVQANPENAGDATEYLWEVSPADAGTFANASAPDTTFEAGQPGEAVITVTATDGTSQAVDQCVTNVSAVAGVVVELAVSPNPPVVGQEATLTCTSVGAVEAVVLAIAEVDGDGIELNVEVAGIATFTPTLAGDLTFSCIGASLTAEQTDPLLLTFSVEQPPDGGGDGTADGGTDRGDKGDETPPDEEPSDGGRTPPRPRSLP